METFTTMDRRLQHARLLATWDKACVARPTDLGSARFSFALRAQDLSIIRRYYNKRYSNKTFDETLL